MTFALSQGCALVKCPSTRAISHIDKKLYIFKQKTVYIPRIAVFCNRKNSSKLKKKKVFLIDSTNQTFIIYKNSFEQNSSDDVTQSYVIKMCVRKTNIALIWVLSGFFKDDTGA